MSDTFTVTAAAPPPQQPPASPQISPEDAWLRGVTDQANGFPGTPRGNADAAYQRLMSDPDLKLTPGAAAGIVMNLYKESGVQGVNQRNPAPGESVAFGWAQWKGPRRDDFEQFAQRNDLDPTTGLANYLYLKHDLMSRPQLLSQLQKTDDSNAAYSLFNYSYEQHDMGRGPASAPTASATPPAGQSPEDAWLQRITAQQKAQAPVAPQQQATAASEPPTAPPIPQPPNSQSFTTVARPGVPSAPPTAAMPGVPQAAAPTPGATAPVPQASAAPPGAVPQVPPVAAAPPTAAAPPVPPASWGLIPNLANAGLFGLLPRTAAADATVGSDLITGTGAPVDNPTSPAPDAAAIDQARRQWTQQHDRIAFGTEALGTMAGAAALAAPAAVGDAAAAGAAKIGANRLLAGAARGAAEGATVGALDGSSDAPFAERVGLGVAGGAVAGGVGSFLAPALRELQGSSATLGDIATKFGITVDSKLAQDLRETLKIVTGTPSGAAGDEVRGLYNKVFDAISKGNIDGDTYKALMGQLTTAGFSKNPATVQLANQLREDLLDTMERTVPELAGTIRGARAQFDAAMTVARSGGAVKMPSATKDLIYEQIGSHVASALGLPEVLGDVLGTGAAYISPALRQAAQLWKSSATYRNQVEAAAKNNSNVAAGLEALARRAGLVVSGIGNAIANPNTAPPPVAP